MSNFIGDDLALPSSKSDRRAIPGGQDPTQWIAAADFNAIRNYLSDARDWVKGAVANYFKLKANSSLPTAASGFVHLGMTSDNRAVVSEHGGRYQEIIRRRWFNIRDYGTNVGGGNATTDTAARAACQAALLAAGGGTFYLPPGFTYNFNSKWTLPVCPLRVLGDPVGYDQRLTVINFTHTNGDDCIYADNSSNNELSGLHLEGFQVVGSSSALTGACVRIQSSARFSLARISTKYGVTGFHFNDTYIGDLHNLTAHYMTGDGYKLTTCNELGFVSCIAVGDSAGTGYGYNLVSGCNINTFKNCDATNLHAALIHVESGAKNEFNGYTESIYAGGNLRAELDKYAIDNNLENVWASMDEGVKDAGVGNRYSSPSIGGRYAAPIGLIKNWASDSSFEGAFTGPVTGFNATDTDCLIDNTTPGITNTVSSLKIKAKNTNNTACTCAFDASAYNVDDVIAVTGWVKASKVMSRQGATQFKVQVGYNGTVGAPDIFTLPYADTTWRPFAFLARLSTIGAGANKLVQFIIANPVANDTVWLADVQFIVNPPAGVHPFDLPYIKTGPTGTARTASMQVPFRTFTEKAAAGLAGVATLSSGITGTISTAAAPASLNRVKIWRVAGGTPANYGSLYPSNLVAGASLKISSSSATDDGSAAWEIEEL